MSKLETALTAIGQHDAGNAASDGSTTSIIANKGAMPRPYLVSKATTQSDNPVFTQGASNLRQVIDEQVASYIADLMENTVSNGTGSAAAIRGVKVCGKTGTAENEKRQRARLVCVLCTKRKSDYCCSRNC